MALLLLLLSVLLLAPLTGQAQSVEIPAAANESELILNVDGDEGPTRATTASTTCYFDGGNWNELTAIGATKSGSWTLSSDYSHQGSGYSIKSNSIGNGTCTSFTITLEFSSSGSITYWAKPSSEESCDITYFYIDGSIQSEEISGTGDWSGYTHSVSLGTHTFKWEYCKDAGVTDGNDCVYIDDIYFSGYKESVSKPTVSTNSSASNISYTSFTMGGNLTSTGGASTTRGICYKQGTSGDPTTSNSTAPVSGSTTSTGTFSVNITGLSAGTSYRCRAYATNSAGTSYGSTYTIATTAAAAPSITTKTVSSITTTTASCGGESLSDNGASITAKGCVWNTSGSPTTSSYTGITSDGTGTDSFTSSLTGLSPSTTYYVRAYATNSKGTTYGTQRSFTTNALTAPSVTTNAVSSISSTTATGNGDVTSDGGASVTERGVCWSTSSNPTTSDSHDSSATTGTGSYSVNMTSLTANTLYHVRAYAKNSVGTGYGSDATFTTLATVGTPAVSSVTGTSATFTATVNAGGGASITGRGVYWSTSSTAPTSSTSLTSSNSVAAGTNATGEFTVSYSSFSKDTHYYVWSYVRNAGGINFSSSPADFTTLGWTVNPNTKDVNVSCLTSGTSVTLTGGSDCTSTKYTLTTASSTYSSISSSPDGTGSTTGDATTYTFSMPFSFELAGTTIASGTTVTMRCDGFASFGSAYSAHTPSSPSSYNVISAFGYDQYLASSSKMYYKVTGSDGSKVLTMEWNNMRSYSTTYNYANYQIKLYQGSNIVELCYGSYTYGKSVTVYIYLTANKCITNLTSITSPAISYNTTPSTSGISVNSASAAPASGTVYRFTPGTYTWSTVSGTSGTANGTIYTVNPTQNSTYRLSVNNGSTTKTADIDVTITETAPTGVTASSITHNSATVSWNAGSASSWQYKLNNGSWTTVNTNSVSLSLSPSTAYTFYVKTNGPCPSSATSINFTTDYIITYDSGSNGTVSGVTHAASGTTGITVTATPASASYELDEIRAYKTGDESTIVTLTGSGNTRTFTMPAYNVTVAATFKSSSFTVTINSNNLSYGTVSGGGTYTSGSASPTANPTDNGYFFKWSDGETTATHSAVSSETTLTAYFVPKNISNPTDWTNFTAAVNGTGDYGDGYNYSGKTVTLNANINMNNTGTPVGTSSKPFQGTFNGNGHTISGYSSSSATDNGLFGHVSGSAQIHDLVVSATISGSSDNAGIVVGTLAAGTMYNVAAVGTLSSTGTNKGGLVGSNSGNIYNCYSNVSYSGSATNMGGLVGSNNSGGNVKNCYAAGVSGSVKAQAGSNSGTIEYCYADAGDVTGTYSGTFTAPQSDIKNINYMYRDNVVTATGNTYLTPGYTNGHAPKWNGLVSVLNQWVADNKGSGGVPSDLVSWYRPLTTDINGDLPIMGFSGHTSVGTNGDAKLLNYGGLDALLTAYNASTASVFLYGSESAVTGTPGSNTHVYLNEDAVLIQSSHVSNNFARTTAGVTFDNSCGAAHSYQGNVLAYDWHLMSTPFSNAPIGIGYANGTAHGAGSGVDINAMSGGFFPDGLGNYAWTGGTVKWDFYAYDNVNHLWINFKRNADNHYDMEGNHITYSDADQTGSTTGNFIPGKGYMMAISQPTYMCTQNRTLNNTNVEIKLTNSGSGIDGGANFIGNPYHGYLNLGSITSSYSSLTTFYLYDADKDLFAPVVANSSENKEIPSPYIHPHQGFFVIAPSNMNLTLTPDMAGTLPVAYSSTSYFREEHINYPLVNLFAENELGQRDMTIIELHRPELGGALKVDQLRNTDFEIAARMNGERYALLFTPEGTERVPVSFRTETDGTYKLTWNTQNGEFYSLFLVDNKTGVTYDMLANDSYTFEANSRDYASRFYITYDCSGTGIEENNEGNGGYGYSNFAYIDNGNIVVDVETQNFASLQVIDMLGRVLYSTTCTDGARTVSTNGLSKGVYVIRLTTDKGTQTQKIVVQ